MNRSEDGVSRRGFLAGIGASVLTPLGNQKRSESVSVERYIVGTDSRAAVQTTKAYATTVIYTLDLSPIGSAVVGYFSEAALSSLREHVDVRYIEPGRTLRLAAPQATQETRSQQTLPWGVDRIDADVAHETGHRGTGVDIAIIDSGIQPEHPDLRENLGSGKAFVECWRSVSPDCRYDPGSGRVKCGLNVRKCPTDWGDDVPGGHGTHVAGTVGALDDGQGVVGVAPAATLHSVKVTNLGGLGTLGDIAAALVYVTDQDWDVANLSLQGQLSSQLIADACRYAVENGVLVVATAGNTGLKAKSIAFPARLDDVVSVGATTRMDRVPAFSSRGEHLDLVAPGADICSTLRRGQSVQSGTSMAAPHVSGVGALLMETGLSNGEARAQLRDTATDLEYPVTRQGAGLVDAAAALDLSSTDDGTGAGVCELPRGRP